VNQEPNRAPEQSRDRQGAEPNRARKDTEKSIPLAYLITFTTYGTWLHGDPRGSVDREHNVWGTPFLDPDRARPGRAGPALPAASSKHSIPSGVASSWMK